MSDLQLVPMKLLDNALTGCRLVEVGQKCSSLGIMCLFELSLQVVTILKACRTFHQRKREKSEMGPMSKKP